MGACSSKDNKVPTKTPPARPADAPVGILKPFHMQVVVKNKDEVIEKKAGWLAGGVAGLLISDEMFSDKVAAKLEAMLPPKIQEAAGIEMTCRHKSTQGSTFTMEMAVVGYDMAGIAKAAFKLDDEKAQTFKAAFEQVTPCLVNMDMKEKAESVHDGVSMKVRRGVMSKLEVVLPAKLEESAGLKADVVVPELKSEPEPAKAEQPTTADVGLSDPMYFTAVINDKKALFENIKNKKEEKEGESSKLMAFACKVGSHLPDSVLAEVVERILQSKIPGKLEEKAGIQSECEALNDSGFDKNVDVKLVVKSFDRTKLLTVAKGEKFAAAFADLWAALQAMADCGVATVADKMVAINQQIAVKVREGVKKKFVEALEKEMCATVTARD
eukprot:TRINITY_DN27783_c0_g1_i1.p1 TRINITY_DN27783_c0_g1~~TRINITY_DN27783_c0_g1_i1.p1  ORF type:complete len:384 (+),score=202.88 TRINITY_DN27783_c0_g1_i1:74-1225(+)